ncbi:hypothetical protein V2J09_000117 [Rumex salicifolius]
MEEQEEGQRMKRRIRTRNDVGSSASTTMRADDGETTSFCINDHADVLLEVLKRLDARSLGVGACVCRLWTSLTRNDVVWEHLCFRHLTPPPSPAVRSLVSSLGGYRRLYKLCVEPALSSLRVDTEFTRRVWTRHGAQLTLSLFCVDYYERLGGAGICSDAATASLMFLCNPVNAHQNISRECCFWCTVAPLVP